MKLLIVPTITGNTQELAERMREKLQGVSKNMTVELWNDPKRGITCADVKKAQTDLLVNFNLSGFEQSTLTDGIAYNLLDCKQIHFLLSDKLTNEKYLARQLSISMFFYSTDPVYCQYLLGKYPDIPYLKEIRGWEKVSGEKNAEKNAGALCNAIREVLEICHMI